MYHYSNLLLLPTYIPLDKLKMESFKNAGCSPYITIAIINSFNPILSLSLSLSLSLPYTLPPSIVKNLIIFLIAMKIAIY